MQAARLPYMNISFFGLGYSLNSPRTFASTFISSVRAFSICSVFSKRRYDCFYYGSKFGFSHRFCSSVAPDPKSSFQTFPFEWSDDEASMINDLSVLWKMFKPGFTYIIMPSVLLMDGIGVRALGRQMFVNVDDMHCSDFVKLITFRMHEAFQSYRDELSGNIFLRWIDSQAYKKPVHSLKGPKPLMHAAEHLDLVSDRYMPFSMAVSSYGLCTVDTTGDHWYHYRPDVFIKRKAISEPQPRVECSVYLGEEFSRKYLAFEFVDEGNVNEFRRCILGSTYNFKDGRFLEASLKLKPLNILGPIEPAEIENSQQNVKIITFDIETYKDQGGILVPYAVGWYIGGTQNYLRKYELHTFYITDYKTPSEMLQAALLELFTIKNHNHVVYVHNLNGFDSPYILATLVELSQTNKIDIKPLVNKGQLLEIRCKFELPEKEGSRLKSVSIAFRDSLRLLPGSLRDLAKSFETDYQKGFFPYDWITRCRAAYVGPRPEHKFFKDLPFEDYNQCIPECYDVKKETLKYLEKDLICLHQILIKFRSKIWVNYQLYIESYLTLPSLSFGIYRCKFLRPDVNIAQTSGVLEHSIRQGYYGGIVEIYKLWGENLKCLDVNSLYPYAMLQPMPTGTPIYHTNPSLDADAFGFFFADIYCPENIKFPTLPYRCAKLGLICPTGKWTGWYFSEELKDAQKRGYTITLRYGYQYNKTPEVFTSFVNHFYEKKKTAVGVERLISKLILNSLFGRFGLSVDNNTTEIVDDKELLNILKTNAVKSVKEFTPGVYLANYSSDVSFEVCQDSGLDFMEELMGDGVLTKMNNKYKPFVSTAISAAITGWARIHMNDYKKEDLYYTDTDSIFVPEDTTINNVGKDIGQFKVECLIEWARFVMSKAYIYKVKGEDKMVKKFKGFSTDYLDVDDYAKLQQGLTVKIKVLKWYKELLHIRMHESPLKIKITSQKRVFVDGGKDSFPLNINIASTPVWKDRQFKIKLSKEKGKIEVRYNHIHKARLTAQQQNNSTQEEKEEVKLLEPLNPKELKIVPKEEIDEVKPLETLNPNELNLLTKEHIDENPPSIPLNPDMASLTPNNTEFSSDLVNDVTSAERAEKEAVEILQKARLKLNLVFETECSVVKGKTMRQIKKDKATDVSNARREVEQAQGDWENAHAHLCRIKKDQTKINASVPLDAY